VRRVTEAEALAHWLEDVAHDEQLRDNRIAAMEASSVRVYDPHDTEAIEKGKALFTLFDSDSADVKQLMHSANVERLETRYNKQSGLVVGHAEVFIRATPQQLVAYMLNYDNRHNTGPELAHPSSVRSEIVQVVSPFHIVTFNRKTAGKPVSDRTFLNSLIAQKVAENPPTYLFVSVPIPSHDLITAEDEKGAVRAENWRAFRATEVSAGRTHLEYVTSFDGKGFLPKIITNTVVLPQLSTPPCECLCSTRPFACPYACASVSVGVCACSASADDAPTVFPAALASRPLCCRRRPSYRVPARRTRPKPAEGIGTRHPDIRQSHGDAP
jgi:hypothetical protein